MILSSLTEGALRGRGVWKNPILSPDAPTLAPQAVRREVFEEARVEVGQVQLLGSQPWPIGR